LAAATASRVVMAAGADGRRGDGRGRKRGGEQSPRPG
jgi:hypothetical protein